MDEKQRTILLKVSKKSMNECGKERTGASCLVPVSFHSEISSPMEAVYFIPCVYDLPFLSYNEIGRYDCFSPMQHVCLKITR